MRTPPLVERALALAAEHGFTSWCGPEMGALLHVLAARRGVRRAAELGTGCGVGAAWIVSALPPGAPLLTVEVDPDLAAVARGLFAHDPDVRVLEGDWHVLLPPEAPLDLVFADAAKQRPDLDGAAVVGLLAPGGTVVLDDFTPGRDAVTDPLRAFWLSHPELVATEIQTSATQAAIVAVRTAGLNPAAQSS